MIHSKYRVSPLNCRHRLGEHYGDFEEAMAAAELEAVREERRFETMMKSLSEDYVEERRALIGAKHLRRYEDLRRKRKQALKTAKPGRQIEAQQIEWQKKAQELIEEAAVDDEKIVALRETYGKRRDEAFRATIGKGILGDSSSGDEPSTASDPIFEPPYSILGPTLTWVSPRDSLPWWDDADEGLMGADMSLRLWDCGEHDSLNQTIRQGWTVFDPDELADRTGRVRVTMDLEPQRFWSSINVWDEAGWSGVHVNRSFRAFARLIIPTYSSTRYYFTGSAANNIILAEHSHNWRDRFPYRQGYSWLPMAYHEEARRLTDFNGAGDIEDLAGVSYVGDRIEDGRYRYSIDIQEEVESGRPVGVFVGIDFYHSVWGDDCTVFSFINYEFRTPRISWEIID